MPFFMVVIGVIVPKVVQARKRSNFSQMSTKSAKHIQACCLRIWMDWNLEEIFIGEV